jgi:antibiotic biosynthesis monooxygenase (ABM) superfamily enzyme
MNDIAGPPHRWKIWLMTTLGIYPVITALAIATGPLLRGLPLPVRLAILIPTSVAIMQWLLLPFLHRTLRSWLLR